MEDYVWRKEGQGGVGVVDRLQESGMEEGGGHGDGMRRGGEGWLEWTFRWEAGDSMREAGGKRTRQTVGWLGLRKQVGMKGMGKFNAPKCDLNICWCFGF